jgi:hypothetical protein
MLYYFLLIFLSSLKSFSWHINRQYGFSSIFSYIIFGGVFPIILDILKNKEQGLHEAYLKQIDQGGVLEIISV